ncbi:unnamed protein product [Rotaria sp. Silwood1]|nr:unnamed protein product [Rotaria sp. Silwood1]
MLRGAIIVVSSAISFFFLFQIIGGGGSGDGDGDGGGGGGGGGGGSGSSFHMIFLFDDVVQTTIPLDENINKIMVRDSQELLTEAGYIQARREKKMIRASILDIVSATTLK